MLNKELQLKIAKLLMEESLLTPEKEAEYISAITALTDKKTHPLKKKTLTSSSSLHF